MVADLLDVVEEVGGEQHGDAERAEAGDQGQHLLAPHRVEAGRGLVEEHELGIGDERLGQLGPLAHAGGEAADGPEAGLVEADQVEHVRCPLAGRPCGGRPLSSPNVATTSAAVWSRGRQSCSGM